MKVGKLFSKLKLVTDSGLFISYPHDKILVSSETRQSFKCNNCSCRCTQFPEAFINMADYFLTLTINTDILSGYLVYYQQAVRLRTCLQDNISVYSKHVLAVLVPRLGLRQHPSLVAHHSA